MSRRAAFLDRSAGEMRGVVTLDGRPERFLISRDGDPPALQLGARSIARVRSVESAFASAFLDLPDGAQALLPLRTDLPRPVRGASVEIEIRAESRRGKLATAWWLGEARGEPQLLEAGPSIEAELALLARTETLVTGREARRIADEAESEVLQQVHGLPGGGNVAIEPTRALTAVDVDTGQMAGGDSKRVSRQANLGALSVAARLLRLKGLGGLVVFDLAGRGHDGAAILAAARSAFASDNPGVAISQISRFGTLEMTIPRRRSPVLDRLVDGRGTLTPLSAALQLARRVEDSGRIAPAAQLEDRCRQDVSAAFEGLAEWLRERLGARISLAVEPGWPVDRLEVISR